MHNYIAVIASALLLAAAVTELSSRFWPGDYWAALVLTVVALLINGVFVLRVAARRPAQAPQKAADKPKQQSQRQRQPNREKNKSQPKANSPRKEKPKRDVPAESDEQGTVKWFNRSKGYGFIVRANGEEIFVHQRSIVSQGDARQRPILRDGQRVGFSVATRDKGVQAEQVVVLD